MTQRENKFKNRQKLIQDWLLFEDLKLYKLIQTSRLLMNIFLIVFFLQLLNLVKVEYSESSNSSQFHKFAYSYFVEVLNLDSVFEFDHQILWLYVGYLISKAVILVLSYIRVKQVPTLRDRLVYLMRLIFALNCFDIWIMFIPLTRFTFLAIQSQITSKIIPCGIGMTLLWLEVVIDLIFGQDFHFKKTKIIQGRSPIQIFVLRMTVQVGMAIKIFVPQGRYQNIVIDFSNAFAGMLFLFYEIKQVNFPYSVGQALFMIVFYTMFILENIEMVILLIFNGSIDTYDPDKMLLIFSPLFLKLVWVVYKTRVRSLLSKDISCIKNTESSVFFMEQFVYNLLNKPISFELYRVFINHYEKCDNMSCYCFLAKYFTQSDKNLPFLHKDSNLYQSLPPLESSRSKKEVQNHLEKINKKPPLKVSIFDSEHCSETLFKTHNTLINKTSAFARDDKYQINLKSKDRKLLINSFYANSLNQNQPKDTYPLLISFAKYMSFSCNNYISSLIYIYNYIYSLQYSRFQTFFRDVVLHNLIHYCSLKLRSDFLDSDYWMSSDSMYEIFNFSKGLNQLEHLMISLFDEQCSYFKELTTNNIDHKYLAQCSKKVLKIRIECDQLFEKMFKVGTNSIKLNKYYVIYQRNVYFKSDRFLQQYHQRVYHLGLNKGFAMNLNQILSREKEVNLYADQHLSLFVNITSNRFQINRFTSNAPAYFGYSEQELGGLLLSDLMPKRIAARHNGYVLDFVNQRKDPIYKTAILKSFALTKTRQLKLVSVLMKLEYFMIDDIFLSGLVIDDPDNKDILILTEEDGKVVAINNTAEKWIGKDLIDKPYGLFFLMPSLLKIFFEQETRNDFSSSQKQNDMPNKRKISSQMKKIKIKSKFRVNLKSKDTFWEGFFFPSILHKLKGLLSFKRNIQSNPFEDFVFDKIAGSSPISGKGKASKFFSLASKLLTANRSILRKNVHSIFHTHVKISSIGYRQLGYKLVKISCPRRIQGNSLKFFKVALSRLKSEIFEVMAVQPKEIRYLYSLLKVEKLLYVKNMLQSKLDSSRKNGRKRRKRGRNASKSYSKNVISYFSTESMIKYQNNCDFNMTTDNSIGDTRSKYITENITETQTMNAASSLDNDDEEIADIDLNFMEDTTAALHAFQYNICSKENPISNTISRVEPRDDAIDSDDSFGYEEIVQTSNELTVNNVPQESKKMQLNEIEDEYFQQPLYQNIGAQKLLKGIMDVIALKKRGNPLQFQDVPNGDIPSNNQSIDQKSTQLKRRLKLIVSKIAFVKNLKLENQQKSTFFQKSRENNISKPSFSKVNKSYYKQSTRKINVSIGDFSEEKQLEQLKKFRKKITQKPGMQRLLSTLNSKNLISELDNEENLDDVEKDDYFQVETGIYFDDQKSGNSSLIGQEDFDIEDDIKQNNDEFNSRRKGPHLNKHDSYNSMLGGTGLLRGDSGQNTGQLKLVSGADSSKDNRINDKKHSRGSLLKSDYVAGDKQSIFDKSLDDFMDKNYGGKEYQTQELEKYNSLKTKNTQQLKSEILLKLASRYQKGFIMSIVIILGLLALIAFVFTSYKKKTLTTGLQLIQDVEGAEGLLRPLGLIIKETQKSYLIETGIIKQEEVIFNEHDSQNQRSFTELHRVKGERIRYMKSFGNFLNKIGCYSGPLKAGSANDKLDLEDCRIYNNMNSNPNDTDNLKFKESSIYSAYFQIGNLFSKISDPSNYNNEEQRLGSEFLDKYSSYEPTILQVFLKVHSRYNTYLSQIQTQIKNHRFFSWVVLLIEAIFLIFTGWGFLWIISKTFKKIEDTNNLLSLFNKAELTFFLEKYLNIREKLPKIISNCKPQFIMGNSPRLLYFEIERFKKFNRMNSSTKGKSSKMIQSRRKSMKSMKMIRSARTIISNKKTNKSQTSLNKTKLFFYLFILISTCVLFLSLFLETYLVGYRYQEIEKLTHQFQVAKSYSSGILAFYGMFYAKTEMIMAPDHFKSGQMRENSKLAINEVYQTLVNKIDQRNILREDLSSQIEIYRSLNQSMCSQLSIDYEDKNRCNFLVDTLGTENLIVALNDLIYFVEESLQNMEATKSRKIFKSDQFLRKDQLTWFLSLKSEVISKMIEKHIILKINQTIIIFYLELGFLFLMISISGLVYAITWKRAVFNMVSNIVNCFVILPSYLLLHNPRIVKHFDLENSLQIQRTRKFQKQSIKQLDIRSIFVQKNSNGSQFR